ncbi:tetratricopeptide repeat protein [Streptomyces sp. MUM 203J]|nr:tetratricopeptide repeat protein [Streptomyces sp. MUM 203J]
MVAAAFTGAAPVAGPPGVTTAGDGQPGSVLAAHGAAASAGSGRPDHDVRALQRHLGERPGDAAGWSALGLAYVEQARTGGDPTRYPQAEKAFARSLRLRAAEDNDAALAGQAALAAARHDFTSALRLADRALRVNPYSERALSTRVDALVELGRYGEAREAVELADRRRPGVPVFTRYAYVQELHGDADGARRVLTRALGSAFTTGDRAYVATELGHLAFGRGRFQEALRHYATALRAEPGYLPALEGRGRARAALGRTGPALRDLEEVVRRSPLPGSLASLAELYAADGQRARAEEQYALAGVWTRLARANGVATDLESALIAADRGDGAEALAAARSEWSRRHSVHAADALAWALHASGEDEEALVYARRATAASPGYRNALFLYHRGMIEHALGDTEAGSRHLREALELNPGFSPVKAREAKSVLAAPAGPGGGA